MKQTSKKLLATSGAAILLATTALAGGTAAVFAQDEVEFDFYTLLHLDPGKTFIERVVADYVAENPGVKINMTILENEALKDKI
ncbi:MAG: hypothetical protein PVG27_06295, partial [Chloroflexota bacterium]